MKLIQKEIQKIKEALFVTYEIVRNPSDVPSAFEDAAFHVILDYMLNKAEWIEEVK